MIRNLTSIVAINEDGAIGCQNTLPWGLKTDMRFFRQTTMGNVVLMGRKTYDSIGGFLPGRINIVLSHNSTLFPSNEHAQLVCSVDEALATCSKIKGKDIFVIGGASVYAQMAPFVDRYLVTMVRKPVPNADAFFDVSIFGNEEEWKVDVVGSYPMTEGVDEAPFMIMSASTLDKDRFTATRNQSIENYRSRMMRQPLSRNTRPKFSHDGRDKQVSLFV